MKLIDCKGQNGVILVQVLVLLTLFSIVGLTFIFYAADEQCQRNPTAVMSENGCTRTIGNTTNTRP